MEPSQTIDHLFRHSFGKIVAVLVNRFGAHTIAMAEDAVQDALLKAMRLWSYQSIPDNPTAWLLVVAKNNMLDQLRRSKQSSSNWQGAMELWHELDDVELDHIIADDQLRIIFACCHPDLSQEYQLILTLKLVAGFNNREVAHALLKKEETIAKAFTRAKRKFASSITSLDSLVEMGLRSRLNIVLKVIFLIFTEGYAATSGSEIIKKDLCYEAIRLALLLTKNSYCQQPNLHALIALMCFHAARFEARIDTDGHLIDLSQQNRKLYDQDLIQAGNHHLSLLTDFNTKPTDYIFQALISYEHCIAKTFAMTNWEKILSYYNLQMKQYYTPMVELNRIIPYLYVHGTEKSWEELKKYEQRKKAVFNSLYHAIKAEIFKKSGEVDSSVRSLEHAIACSQTKFEQAHFQKKISALV